MRLEATPLEIRMQAKVKQWTLLKQIWKFYFWNFAIEPVFLWRNKRSVIKFLKLLFPPCWSCSISDNLLSNHSSW